MTRYSIRPIDELAGHAIVTWHYAPPYDFYNPLGDTAEQARFLCDPVNDYHAIYTKDDQEEVLVGYCCFGAEARVPGGDYGEEALDIGVGMHPALTGAGRGHDFVGAIIEYGIDRYVPETLRATVAAFNARSQATFLGHGFAPVQRMQSATALPVAFVILTREAAWP
jgi:RimJ/RimL family protein N-acetyltransferase